MEKMILVPETSRKDVDVSSNPEQARQNVSFKFSKQISKKVTGNKLDDDNEKDKEMILSVEDRAIKGSGLKLEKKKPLVIKPVYKNIWRRPVSNEAQITRSSLEELAVEELLKESAVQNEKWEKREFTNVTVAIPMLMENKIPAGFETDEKLNVQLRAEESKLEDYENVPIEDFGQAVLRGLGCNPGDPIGNKNQKYIKPVEAVVRSKGLGLGADVKSTKKETKSKEKEEELKLVVGAYVRIVQGNHGGHYGEVDSLDESRVIVKISSKKETVSLPLLLVEVVSKKEFKKESKVLNRTAYDEYKKVHESQHKSRTEDHPSQSSENGHVSSSSGHEKAGSSKDAHKKRKHSAERESSSKHHADESRHRHKERWVCPMLKVRFIDDQYKKGKFFNQKMIVEDVLSSNNLVCKTDDGKYLEDISPDMLETVIPRSEGSYVKIVLGKYKGQLGVILKRDKSNCIATVHFLSDRGKVAKIEYDSICEYVGDVSQYD